MKFRRRRQWSSVDALASVLEWVRRQPWLERAYGQRGSRKRRVSLGVTAFFSMFTIGYAVAAVVLFPAPILARAKAVPRLIGERADAAQATLERIGFAVDGRANVNHPSAPRGEVVWQDPPPGVALPTGSGVAIEVSRGPQRIPIPDVTEYEQAIATQIIQAAGLRVSRIDTSTAPVPRGVVVSTRPPAGQTLPPGEGIILFVSVGASTITVPDLAGLTVEEARDALEQDGLVLGSTRLRSASSRPESTILEQDPASGTLSAPGAAVNVVVVRERNRD